MNVIRWAPLIVAVLLLEGCCAPPGNFWSGLVLSPCGDPRYWQHPPEPAPDP